MPCPGSVALIAQLPPQSAGYDADKGTVAHDLAELALKTFIENRETGTDPYKQFEQAAKVRNMDYSPAEWEEMVEGARQYRDLVWEHGLGASITEKVYGFEDYFTFDAKLDAGGYADFWSVWIDDRGKRVALLVDYKSGKKYVTAKNNLQLLLYCLAFLRELRSHGKDIDYMRAAIVQPKTEPMYREAKYTVKQLAGWEKKFTAAVHKVYFSKKPKLKVGDHCEWCRAQGVCPQYKKELSAHMDLALLDSPDDVILPDVPTIPVDQIAKMLTYEGKIVSFLKSLRKYATNRAMNGLAVPGMKLIERQGRTGWIKNEEELKNVLIMGGLTEDQFTKKSMAAISKVTQELKTKHGAKGAKEIVSELTTKGKTRIALVPENDPAPAVKNLADLLPELVEEESDEESD